MTELEESMEVEPDDIKESEQQEEAEDEQQEEAEDELSDSDESDEVADQKTQERIRLLRKQVSEYPLYYDGHASLIKALRESGELLEARQAREGMNKHYPLSPELWLEWIKDEQSVCSSEEERAFVTSLLDRAVNDYACVKVWTEYLLHSVGSGDVSAAREVAERALTAVGCNVRDGDLIWQAVLMVETEVYASIPPAAEGDTGRSPQQQQQAKRIQSLIKRRFRVPLLNMDEATLLSEAEHWYDGKLEHYMKPDLKKTLSQLQQKLPFEEKLLQTDDDPVSNVAAYQAYLTELRNKKQPTQLHNLYERAVLKHPLNAVLWEDYVQWCLQQFTSSADLLLSITGRSLRNCQWSGQLCRLHLHALQRCHKGDDLAALHNTVKGAVEACLFSLSGMDEGVVAKQGSVMWLSYVVYLLRCVHWPEHQHDGQQSSTVASHYAPQDLEHTDNTTSNNESEDVATDDKEKCSSKDDCDVESRVRDHCANKNNSADEAAEKDSENAFDAQFETVREACRRGLQMIRKGGFVPGEGDVALWRLWAGAEERAGRAEEARQLWNEVLAQAPYTGRHDLWIEFIDMERRMGCGINVRKLYRRALERVWDNIEVIATAFQSFEQIHGDVHTMDDFLTRHRKRMVIVNKRREEMKLKEDQKEAQIKGNKKNKQRSKQQPGQYNKTEEARSNVPRQDTAGSSGQSSGQSHSGTGNKEEVAPPPGYPGSVKRRMDEPVQHSSAKRTKGSGDPSAGQESARKVAEGQDSGSKVDAGQDSGSKAAAGQDSGSKAAASQDSGSKAAAGQDSASRVAAGQESRTVFVSNLDYTTTLGTVTAIFEGCGNIKDAKLVKDFKGRSKGFGFVVFEATESLREALKKDRTVIGARPMFVSTYESDKKGHSFKYSTGVEKDKLFIRGLPYSMSEQEVKEAFEVHAPISEIRLVTHRNGYSKGTCFIKFANAAAAEKVRQAMDQTELKDFTITVLISDPSAPKRQNLANPAKTSQYTLENKKHGSKSDDQDVKSRTEMQYSENSGIEPSVAPTRRPTLAFFPRSLGKPRGVVAAPANLNSEEAINGGPKPKPKSNDDFRKMMMKTE